MRHSWEVPRLCVAFFALYSEQWRSVRITRDLQGRRTSSRRRGSERERWNCLNEEEIIASHVVVSSTTASLGCWTSFFSLPLSLFSWSTRALRTPPPGTLKSLFHDTVFLSRFFLSRLLDFPFGTSLFALQPESERRFVLSDRPIIMDDVCRAFHSNKVDAKEKRYRNIVLDTVLKFSTIVENWIDSFL